MFTTRPELSGDFGMVTSTHWLATAAGMSVLERGGNAFDAAAAAGFVTQVVDPQFNGPAGEVPILLWSAADEQVHVLAGQGVTPALATVEYFTGLGLERVPKTGLLAATVPAAFATWLTMVERWGAWRLRDVLEQAIGYAERGFPVLRSLADTIRAVEQLFRDDWNTSAQTWLPGGSIPSGWHRQPVLAATFRRVVAEAEARSRSREGQFAAARDIWYSGFVAEEIDAFCRTAWRDTSGQRHHGLLTATDLAAWTLSVEAPVTFDYGRYTVCKTGPWGQGPVALQQLALLDGFDLTTMDRAEWVHTLNESAKLAFADREAWYGDPYFADVPLDALLSKEYNEERRALIGSAASLAFRPGSPNGRIPVLPPVMDPEALPGLQISTIEPVVASNGATRGDTCHLDVADRFGNLVSATPSGGWLQSSPTIPSLGFCLGTRAQVCWQQHGLANSLRPGARPRTTLSPTIVLRDGRPWLAYGTPGADLQDQWSVHFLLSVVHGSGNLQEAVEAPNFDFGSYPTSFYPRTAKPVTLCVERGIGDDVLAELRRRGHSLDVRDDWSIGYVCAVTREDDGTLRAAANPRGTKCYAAGR